MWMCLYLYRRFWKDAQENGNSSCSYKGKRWLGLNGGNKLPFHNLNPFVPLKLYTILTNLSHIKTKYKLQIEHL